MLSNDGGVSNVDGGTSASYNACKAYRPDSMQGLRSWQLINKMDCWRLSPESRMLSNDDDELEELKMGLRC